VLPGTTPDKITSKVDSLWAAEKKEDSHQQSPKPRNNLLTTPNPQEGNRPHPRRISPNLVDSTVKPPLLAKRQEGSALISLTYLFYIFSYDQGKKGKGSWKKSSFFCFVLFLKRNKNIQKSITLLSPLYLN
jgi:hypothetical protein